MKNTKESLTVIVIAGYLLLAALAGLAVWFIYNQVLTYTSITESDLSSNNKLYLVGEAATNLYETESISRQIIQTGDPEQLSHYKSELDSIRTTLDILRNTYTDTLLKQEIDSINHLLGQKTENLEELLELRTEQGDQSYYSRVIAELRKVDETFDDRTYDERFKDLEPHQRRVLIQLLEFSELETTQRGVTQQTLDSVVNQVKSVLVELEQADRRYRETVRKKENQLLANEVNLNAQLRNLLSTIEAEEREASLEQVEASQNVLRNTSQIIAVLGAISFLVILIFLFLVIRDVSKSQRYRRELENAKQYAETLLESREQFMATVTHDLRSPLNTVLGYTALLEQTRLNKPQTRYLNHLKNSSEFILRLVNDLLDFSKLEAGKMSVEKLPFNPKNVIEETVENCIPAKKMEELEIKVNISQELDQSLVSDPFRIKQILTNLVTNACKFTSEGSIEVNAFLTETNRKKIMEITVKDTGIGISQDKIEEVFEEFSQEDPTIERRFGGSGLGLAISKKLATLLKGSIELESEPGKGSTFKIRIPVEVAEIPPPVPVSKTKNRPALEPGRFSILIVDDEPAQLSLLQELIRSTGMKTSTAVNGQQALEKLRTQKFDLVLTDIQMPVMDGFELVSAIKKNPEVPEVPVIALSGKTDTMPPEYLEKGFRGSLLKPYSSKKLLRIIGDVLHVDLKEKEFKDKTRRKSRIYSLSEIKKFAGGDRHALQNILKSFIESTESNLVILQQADKEGDEERTAAIAHRMLPMFRQLKAGRIVKQLEILEHPKPGEKSIEISTLTSQIHHLLKELHQELID